MVMLRTFEQCRKSWTLITRRFSGVLGVSISLYSPAAAQTLEEALSLAYAANPEIAVERAQLDATREGVAQARAGGRPQITAGAG